MAINFPSSPSVNQTHTHSGKEWTWNGTSWVISTSASNYTLPIATAGGLGGIKVGNRLTIDAVSGVLDADVQTSSFGTSDVDAHLNQSNPTSGYILQWNGSDYAWVAQSNTTSFTALTDTPGSLSADQWVKVNAGGTALEFTSAPSGGSYSNSDVDTHLNQSNPTSGYVLSWNGSDYAWVAQTTDTNTQLSTEQVQDIVGAMFSSNTETRIAATYQDGDGTIDLVVDDMTANDNTQLSTEQVQDIVGAMFTGNTETRITATYEDSDGTIDLVVDDMNDTDTNTNDYVSNASLSGNTLTINRTGSQSLSDITVDLSTLGGGGASVTVSDSAPAGPSSGDLWWDSDHGRLKVYYTDATPDSQWVDTNPIGSTLDLTAFTGHILPDTHDQQDIGSATKKIRDLYLGSTSLHIGTVDVSESGGKLVLPAVEMTGHFIPDTNAAYDLGNAEYKIRHLFLSDNSLKFVDDSNVEHPLSVSSGKLHYEGKEVLANCVFTSLDNNDTIKYNGTNWVNSPAASGYANSDVDTHLNQSNPTANHVLSWDGSDYAWVAQSSGGSPGGSTNQLQINDGSGFAGCNLKYSTNLDGSLEWTNASGTSGARISCYHSTISGGDGSIIFYAGGGMLGTLNMRIFNNSVTVYGALTKGSGSFRIPHPLPALKDTKDLVHSFIEGPQCDNLYRGKVDLVGGTATVNLDTKSDMTAGTFVALNRDVQCFTTNETGWTAVKGSVSGNILTITAQDNTCTDTISWMVVGERQDDNIKSSVLTDATGKLIMEPNQIPLPPTS